MFVNQESMININLEHCVHLCRHSPHVATGDFNVLTESCSDTFQMTNTLCLYKILTTVDTAIPMLPNCDEKENAVGHHRSEEVLKYVWLINLNR